MFGKNTCSSASDVFMYIRTASRHPLFVTPVITSKSPVWSDISIPTHHLLNGARLEFWDKNKVNAADLIGVTLDLTL